jgi:hypothetical protein
VPDGAIVLPSVNYLGYALLRSILKSGSDADVKTAVAYGKRIKLYPLSQAAKPPETVFIDAMGSSTIPRSHTMSASSNRSTVSCSRSLGCSATRR